jgi:hypothetical protein
MSADPTVAVGFLSYCVNSLEDISNTERSLLREMLMAAQTNSLRAWGTSNQHRADEVWKLFEKIKGRLNAP